MINLWNHATQNGKDAALKHSFKTKIFLITMKRKEAIRIKPKSEKMKTKAKTCHLCLDQSPDHVNEGSVSR